MEHAGETVAAQVEHLEAPELRLRETSEVHRESCSGMVCVDDRVADLMKMKEENDAIIPGRGGGRSLLI